MARIALTSTIAIIAIVLCISFQGGNNIFSCLLNSHFLWFLPFKYILRQFYYLAHALKCYNCDSQSNPSCGTTFDKEKLETSECEVSQFTKTTVCVRAEFKGK